MLSPVHKYMLGELRENISSLNRFLTERSVDFALTDEQLKALGFGIVSDGQSGVRVDKGKVYVLVPEIKQPVQYWAGRVAGTVYHVSCNPGFFPNSDGKPDLDIKRVKVKTVVQHAFAMLTSISQDEAVDLGGLVSTSAAQDPKSPYSLVEEIRDPLSGRGFDVYKARSRERQKEEKRKRDEDAQFDPSQKTDFGFEREFAVSPECEEYKRREREEGASDDPLEIILGKQKYEEANTARILIEGRSQGAREGSEWRNWEKSLGKLLRMDVKDAIAYLAGLFHY